MSRVIRRRDLKQNRIKQRAAAKELQEYLTAPAPSLTPITMTEAPIPALNPQQVLEEEVRLQAYLKWEAAGRPPGDGADFWISAERELQRV